ncbi:type II toxin-antitoxin system RelE/ParE family toxin [Streptomyces microflavus]|uniref:type II toxin-antitoxin system RelE family toxin n=1 Tax=Streptomyces microflavus TaxID=1919 RepID=UPI003318894B
MTHGPRHASQGLRAAQPSEDPPAGRQTHPRSPGRPPEGLGHRRRVRVPRQAASGPPRPMASPLGSHRTVYTVEDGRLIAWVLAVGHRRETYRNL